MINRIGSLTGMLLLLCASSGAAQGATLEWIPYGGVFVPTRELGTATINGTGYEIKQNAGAAFGARLIGWFSRVVGWEGNFMVERPGREPGRKGHDVAVHPR